MCSQGILSSKRPPGNRDGLASENRETVWLPSCSLGHSASSRRPRGVPPPWRSSCKKWVVQRLLWLTSRQRGPSLAQKVMLYGCVCMVALPRYMITPRLDDCTKAWRGAPSRVPPGFVLLQTAQWRAQPVCARRGRFASGPGGHTAAVITGACCCCYWPRVIEPRRKWKATGVRGRGRRRRVGIGRHCLEVTASVIQIDTVMIYSSLCMCTRASSIRLKNVYL